MIAIRKEISAFADHNNRELLDVENPHIFAFSRFDTLNSQSRVLVIGNFSTSDQALDLTALRRAGFLQHEYAKDMYSGENLSTVDQQLLIPALAFYWLQA